MSFGELGVVALVVYMGVLATIAEIARRARSDGSPSDHFLAGRDLGVLVLFLTLYATAYSGNSLLGYPGRAYSSGFSFIMATGFMMSIIVAFHMLVPRLRPLAIAGGFVTPGDYVRHRFGEAAGGRGLQLGVALLMTVALANFLFAQLKAMGELTAVVTGGMIPYEAGVIGLASMILFYETLGGMRAVAWTDAAQGVLMLFGLLDPSRVAAMLDAFASPDFSAEWGVRMLSAWSPLFDPQSYHGGTVWPLFTGWTALAEYAYGRPAQGFAHVMNTLLLYRHHALGFADEVLHGTRFAPRGVCPHQCWSETGALHPILAGLIGFHPDAPHQRLRLEPRLPLHWDTFRVDNLRMGSSRLHLDVQREPSRTTYRLTLVEGPAVEVAFAPEIPRGMKVVQLLVNGTTQPLAGRGPLGLLDPPLAFTLEKKTIIDLRHTGGGMTFSLMFLMI